MRIPYFAKWLFHKPRHWIIKAGAGLYAKELSLEYMHNVVIIAPHPDDEVFGCGGLIAKLIELGVNVSVIFLTKGEAIAKGNMEDIIVAERKKLSIDALRILGLDDSRVYYLDFEDGNISKDDEKEVQKLKVLIENISPDTVFYPHMFEGSPDHEIASDIVASLSLGFAVNMYFYCVWLWHHASISKLFRLKFYKSCYLQIDRNLKLRASAVYSEAKTNEGMYYSGRLPKLFLEVVNQDKELFFKA